MSDPLHPEGDPEQVCLAGDWHGNTFWAVNMLERIAGHARVVLHVGDWGLRDENPSFIKFVSEQNRALRAMDGYLVVTPGNHDSWDRLRTLPIDPDTGLQKLTNRIWFMPRGHRWRYGNYQWMSCGGAISVDRHRRTTGRDYWPAEATTQADIDRSVAGGPVDVLVSHDVPAGVRVPGLGRQKWPDDAIADSDAHRALLRQLVDQCRPRHAWCGHMHVAYSDDLELGRDENRPEWSGVLRVHGLNSDTGPWRDNLALVGPDGARMPWPG